jgi:hypothetical protein
LRIPIPDIAIGEIRCVLKSAACIGDQGAPSKILVYDTGTATFDKRRAGSNGESIAKNKKVANGIHSN